MVRIESVYDGNLRCSATHIPSGQTLVTDAPVDNMGKGVREIIINRSAQASDFKTTESGLDEYYQG